MPLDAPSAETEMKSDPVGGLDKSGRLGPLARLVPLTLKTLHDGLKELLERL